MHPKTFSIRIKKPFGDSIHVYTHAESHQEALAWVERMFEGVDTSELIKRWESPSDKQRVGNSDSLIIVDCDAYSTLVNEGGVKKTVAVTDGSNRRSVDEIASRIIDIANRLQKEVETQKKFFRFHTELKHRGEFVHDEKMAKYAENAQQALTWANNAWSEAFALQKMALEKEFSVCV